MENMIWFYAVGGVLLILASVPMITERVPPNRWYGFRTPRTQSDPKVWYPANRMAGQYLAFAGLLIELATLGVALFHKQITPATGATILLVVGIGSIAAASVLSFLALRRI
jgi:uncharacterized membrane protein